MSNRLNFPTLFPQNLYLREHDIRAITRNRATKTGSELFAKTTAVSGLYLRESVRNGVNAVFQAVAAPCSLLLLGAATVVPQGSLIYEWAEKAYPRIPGVSNFLTSVFKCILCAAMVFVAPLLSVFKPQSLEKFYTFCNSESTWSFDPPTILPKKRTQIKKTEEKEVKSLSEMRGVPGELRKIINKLIAVRKNPQVANLLGGGSRSLLLFGAPGCGKTTYAKAIAKEFQNAFPDKEIVFRQFEISEHVSTVMHATVMAIDAERDLVKELCEEGKIVIYFFDEIDMKVPTRTAFLHNHEQQELGAIFQLIDALLESGAVVISGTNRMDKMDPALLRPGRLGDIKLEITSPSKEQLSEVFLARLEDFKNYLARDDYSTLLQFIDGLTYSDLDALFKRVSDDIIEGIVNESSERVTKAVLSGHILSIKKQKTTQASKLV